MKESFLTPEKLDSEYNNRARIPETEKYFSNWAEQSKKIATKPGNFMDVCYGKDESEKLDIFPPVKNFSETPHENSAPVLIFIHGGYWQTMDKADFSFVSEHLTTCGALVVVVNYALCPQVSIADITEQMYRACAWVYENIADYGGNPKHIVISGHSAGGHLSAMMLQKNWQTFHPKFPEQIFHSALSISGLFDLEPISRTPFLQKNLNLSSSEAVALSPALLPSPKKGVIYTIVGDDESDEFKRQNRLLQKAWGEEIVPLVEMLEGLNHFDAVEKMNAPKHRLFRILLSLLGLSSTDNPSIPKSKDTYLLNKIPEKNLWPVFAENLPSPKLNGKLNLVEELFRTVPKENAFLRDEKNIFTYGEAYHKITQIAEVLIEEFGLIPGNRVLIRGNNNPMTAMIWLAVIRSGMVAVTTMGMLRDTEIRKVADKSRPSLIICEDSLMEEIQKNENNPLPIIRFNRDQDSGLERLLSRKNGTRAAQDTDADDIAVLAFTSGTTGFPKAPMHSHKNILGACYAWPKHILKQKGTDIIIGTPPFAFTFGLGGQLLFPMVAGASIYYPGKAVKPEMMVEIINRIKATVCYSSPTFYRQMIPFVQKTPVPSLRISVSAGEALPDGLRQQWKQTTGLDMIDGIGATEMFHIFISSSGQDIRAGSIGKAVPGYFAKIMDDEGNELAKGQDGNLAVIGPTGCLYMEDDRQKNYVKNGWNYPGDICRQDEDGYFYYLSRSDDLIVSSGYNISPIEIEDALCSHPDVKECAVIGVPDEARGQIAKAFVVLNDFSESLQSEKWTKTLQNFVKDSIAPYKYPREIEFVESLPKTNTGKLQRFALRNQ